MPDPTQKKPALLMSVRADAGDLAAAEKPLPAVLQVASRGAGGGPDRFLANVVVEESYTLVAVGRGEAADTRRIEDGRKLLALEAADGTTIFAQRGNEHRPAVGAHTAVRPYSARPSPWEPV